MSFWELRQWIESNVPWWSIPALTVAAVAVVWIWTKIAEYFEQ